VQIPRLGGAAPRRKKYMDKNPTLWGVIAALVGAGLQPLGVSGPAIGMVLLAIAFLFLIYTVRGPILEWWSDTVPLSTAARQFYEEARKSNSYWSDAADRLSLEDTPTARLNYCAHALKHSDIKWFAVHPPSTIREELPPSIVNSCSFLNDELQILGTNGRTYSAVRVSKRGLKKLLTRVREGTSDI